MRKHQKTARSGLEQRFIVLIAIVLILTVFFLTPSINLRLLFIRLMNKTMFYTLLALLKKFWGLRATWIIMEKKKNYYYLISKN